MPNDVVFSILIIGYNSRTVVDKKATTIPRDIWKRLSFTPHNGRNERICVCHGWLWLDSRTRIDGGCDYDSTPLKR